MAATGAGLPGEHDDTALRHSGGVDRSQRWVARRYDQMQARYEAWFATRKRELFSTVRGDVLEIGPGTGANFAYYQGISRWVGIEPNRYMHEQASAKAQQFCIGPIEWRTEYMEQAVIEAASFDVVVASLVLCSVRNPALIIGKAFDALRPGGRLVFLEHVVAPRLSGLWWQQKLLRPIWNYLNDGCCPDRDMCRLLRDAGFESLEVEHFSVPPQAAARIVSPHIAGFATK